jgi:hypothetical protein
MKNLLKVTVLLMATALASEAQARVIKRASFSAHGCRAVRGTIGYGSVLRNPSTTEDLSLECPLPLSSLTTNIVIKEFGFAGEDYSVTKAMWCQLNVNQPFTIGHDYDQVYSTPQFFFGANCPNTTESIGAFGCTSNSSPASVGASFLQYKTTSTTWGIFPAYHYADQSLDWGMYVDCLLPAWDKTRYPNNPSQIKGFHIVWEQD